MVPNIGQDSILLLGYSTLYKEHNLTRFNHQKIATQVDLLPSNREYNQEGPFPQ